MKGTFNLNELGRIAQYLNNRRDVVVFYSINKKCVLCLSLMKENVSLDNDFTSHIDYFLFVQRFYPSSKCFCGPMDVLKILLPVELKNYESVKVTDMKRFRTIDMCVETLEKLVEYTGEFTTINRPCNNLKRITLIHFTERAMCDFKKAMARYPRLEFVRLYVDEKIVFPKEVLKGFLLYIQQFNPFMKVVLDFGKYNKANDELIMFVKKNFPHFNVVYHTLLTKYEVPYNPETNPFYLDFFNNYVYMQMVVFQGTFFVFQDDKMTSTEEFLKDYYITELHSNATEGNYKWITTLSSLKMQKRVFSLTLPSTLKTLEIGEDFLYYSYNLQNIAFDCQIKNLEDLAITHLHTLKMSQKICLPTTLKELNIEVLEDNFVSPSSVTLLRISDVANKPQITLNSGLKELFICQLLDFIPHTVEYLYVPCFNKKLSCPLLSLEVEVMKKGDGNKLPSTLKNLLIHSTPSFGLSQLTHLTQLAATVLVSNSIVKVDKYELPKTIKVCKIHIKGNISKNKETETMEQFTKHFGGIRDLTITAEFKSKIEKKLMKYLN
ncbi:hypothetical protein EIN_097090 [Entamoeba invadens IP1]|uniref:Uncharacterized protein n=1 Tax=Entamoeba invadens IP1 TaxID=370355 RepID=A0A0A1U0P1_ENTIV|nr:hypothetical protein EIN_097090 [Entamoeba invadens IP1]ELP87442.1 hypothetical protein EIN_097090 [Entamoeba invadens IP1]|eukprot:XP_004254213.1 hypothetical protein EIN_097090 [Entamoeba invadens IP1]